MVDDGVDFRGAYLRRHVWNNVRELPGNSRDDDGNGRVDDVRGWDFADGDSDPAPPAGRGDRDHGTYLAHLMVDTWGAVLTEAELARIRIMPVKVMADAPGELRLANAYAGVAYAAAQGADVILMAWNDPVISEEEKAVLDRARARGALLIGSAGNQGVENPMYPAAHEAVLAVAALQGMSRLPSSNYGGFVDVAAPGFQVSVRAAADFGGRARDGTSPAAAQVAAAATALIVRRPGAAPDLIRACLMATATPLAGLEETEQGRLGAGRLDVAAAVSCVEHGPTRRETLAAPKGVLFALSGDTSDQSFTLVPTGVFDEIVLQPATIPGLGSEDTQVRIVDATLGRVLFSGALAAMNPLSTAASTLQLTITAGEPREPAVPLLSWAARPKLLQNRFCAEPVELLAPAIIEDGSGADSYAPGSDCYWLISAPQGQGLRFRFLALDTEARRDLVYLFAGPRTDAEIAAVVSGSALPPAITVPRSTSLLWFVSDLARQGAGFRVRVEPVSYASSAGR